MSRRFLALSLPLLAVLALGARKPTDPKHENHYKPVAPAAADGVSFVFEDVESQQQFIQIGAKITNNSTDKLLILKKTEGEFVLPTGPVASKAGGIGGLFGSTLVVLPGDTKGNTWKVEGDSGFHVDTFSFHPKGFYTAPNTGTPVAVPDFALPASRNDFTAGPYSCKLSGSKQTTDDTSATFVCTYNGKGIGLVDPTHLAVKEPGGKEYASLAKGKRDILFPGDSTKLNLTVKIEKSVVDMQFATLQVLWRDALSESATTPLAVADWSFDIDAAKTADANK